MSETLLSVGLDVGTTSTQLIVSELTVENRASGFAVPELKITDRQVRYRSPVYFTPLEAESRVDGEALRELVSAEYEKAGITRQQVDTGAVIVTGETSRKENARRVVQALSEFAGEFVVATAGPDLESVLAAKGAGAVGYSADTGKTVLHMDIGGGTANLALAENGEIRQTGCLNVGGRLLKFAQDGTLTYISPVLEKLCKLKQGDRPGIEEVERIAELLTAALEMAAGLRDPTELLAELTTREDSADTAGALLFRRGGGLYRNGAPALCLWGHGACIGSGNQKKRPVRRGIPAGGGNYPGHGDRRRVPQHQALRQHGVPPEYPVPPEKSARGENFS